MQLLPQQSEVDDNSLKKFPICQVPSLEGVNKACLKPLQPRDEGPRPPTVRREQLPTKAVEVIQDLQWKIWAQTWNGQGLIHTVFPDVNAGLLQFLPALQKELFPPRPLHLVHRHAELFLMSLLFRAIFIF